MLAKAALPVSSNYRIFVGDSSQGYPIVGLTWMMVYKRYSTPDKAAAVKKFVEWVLTNGQTFNA
ncbi:Periplasmic phosphate binding protein [Richelia intracellularis]|nr:Periplasmic phosphate binding protein [Richelia intracellularis]